MHREWTGRYLTKKTLFAVLSCMALWFGDVCIAAAQEAAREIIPPGKLGQLEKKVQDMEARSISDTMDLHLYGYVDISYSGNLNNPFTGTNSQRVFDVDSDAFRVHLAQIVLEKLGKRGDALTDNFGFRVKLNFGEDSQFTGGSDFGDEVDFQEVYAQYVAPIGSGIDFRVGRQNTLIGYEVIESPYNDNFSRSWLFGYGQPFTTTGLRGAYDITENLSFAIGAISGFTQQTGDTNSDLSLETAFSYTPHEKVNVTGYLFWGDERGRKTSGSGEVILAGGIGTLKFTDQTKMIVEAYYANAANASGLPIAQDPSQNARWNGVAAYLIHDFTDQWGLRIRGEVFEDPSASRTCLGPIGTPGAPGSPPAPRVNVCPVIQDGTNQFGARNGGTAGGSPGPVFGPIAQTLWETTFTLQFRPIPSFITRLEYRYDKSNENTFLYGTRANNNQNTLSAEVIYLF